MRQGAKMMVLWGIVRLCC